jgi:hypothetical protein
MSAFGCKADMVIALREVHQHTTFGSVEVLSGRHSGRGSSVSCSPSNPILVAEAADLSVRKIYLDHIFR